MKNSKFNTGLSQFEYISFAGIAILLLMLIVGIIAM